MNTETNDTPDESAHVSEPLPGAMSGNVRTLPIAPSRPLSRTLESFKPDPALVAEAAVLARLKPLHEQFLERLEAHERQLVECERRLQALEATR